MTDGEDESQLAPVAALLRSEHARLEGLYAGLLAAYQHGDWTDVLDHWNVFEPALRAHIETEERRVFPAFREVNPTEAAALLAEHNELRDVLATLGVNIELHSVTPLDVEELVRRLRAHGAREELVLYPWLDASAAPSATSRRSTARFTDGAPRQQGASREAG
jgi:hemerythrin-like domain-containing protein